MSLTGPVFAWTATILTAAAFVALVWLWPVLGGRAHPGRIMARAGALAMVNVLVLTTSAIWMNDQFLFFAGWPDLVGALGGVTTTTAVHGGGKARLAANSTASGPAATAAKALQPLPAGSLIQDGVRSYTVSGPLSGLTGQVLVSLPTGYQSTSARLYPVLETFSGYPGAVTQWVKTMSLRSVLDGRLAAGRLGATVMVSPQTEFPAGVDTECVNGSSGQPQVETWLARDVPDWVVAHFRVRTDRASWATIGLSAGAWCSAMITMLHPAQYAGAIVLGGYFRPDFPGAYEPFPPGSDPARRYDLVALAKHDPPPVAIWVETSHADPLSYGTSSALLKEARPPLSVTATILRDAGHRIGVWRDLLPTALDWLAGGLSGFAP